MIGDQNTGGMQVDRVTPATVVWVKRRLQDTWLYKTVVLFPLIDIPRYPSRKVGFGDGIK
jgi:hypothetical protein